MTIPLPALAEKRNPALKRVNIANPFACSNTFRGITCSCIVQILIQTIGRGARTPSRPLFPLSTNDTTKSCDQRLPRSETMAAYRCWRLSDILLATAGEVGSSTSLHVTLRRGGGLT